MAMGTTRRAGRPREFDTAAVLDRAVDVFWEFGYAPTTTRDLERRLEISQSSLYNTFGSKRGLLLAAIDRYETRIREELFTILEAGTGLDGLESFLRELGRWIADNEHRGCLVVNLMASASDDPQIAERAVAYRATIRTALLDALRGEPGVANTEAKLRADVLLAAVLGLHITARSTTDPSEVTGIVKALCAQVRSWR